MILEAIPSLLIILTRPCDAWYVGGMVLKCWFDQYPSTRISGGDARSLNLLTEYFWPEKTVVTVGWWLICLPNSRRKQHNSASLGFNCFQRNGASLELETLDPSIDFERVNQILSVSPGRRDFVARCLTGRRHPLSRSTLDDLAKIYSTLSWSEDGHLNISGDFLGLAPIYLVETEHGEFVSNSLRPLLALQQSEPFTPDPVAMVQLMYFRTPIGSRTLLKRVKLLPPGKTISWKEDGGFHIVSKPYLSIEPADPAISTSEAIDSIYSALLDSVRRQFAIKEQPVSVAMSGGYDSRMVAGALDALGADVRLYMHGTSTHSETYSARALAKRLGKRLHLLAYPADMLYRHQSCFLKVTEGQVDPHIMHIANLFQAELDIGNQLGHGFLGDAISGRSLNRIDFQERDSREGITEKLIARHAQPAIVELVQSMGLAIHDDDLRQSILDSLPPAPTIYQSLVLWFIEQLNRRFASAQCRVLNERYRSILPFVDKTLIEIWLKQPRYAFDNRYLNNALIRRCFPKLADVPHPEEAFAPEPRLSEMSMRALLQLPRNLRKLIRQKSGFAPKAGSRNAKANTDIMRMSYGGVDHDDRINMSARVKEGEQALLRVCNIKPPDDLLGVCFPDNAVRYDGLHALRRIWGMTIYAEWVLEIENRRTT